MFSYGIFFWSIKFFFAIFAAHVSLLPFPGISPSKFFGCIVTKKLSNDRVNFSFMASATSLPCFSYLSSYESTTIILSLGQIFFSIDKIVLETTSSVSLDIGKSTRCHRCSQRVRESFSCQSVPIFNRIRL